MCVCVFQVRSSGLLCAVALLFCWIAVLLAVAVGAVLAPPAGVIAGLTAVYVLMQTKTKKKKKKTVKHFTFASS